MEDRQPTIDHQTFEALYKAYAIVAKADQSGSLAPSDITYVSGILEMVLLFNSDPGDGIDPRKDPKLIDNIKALGRKVLP